MTRFATLLVALAALGGQAVAGPALPTVDGRSVQIRAEPVEVPADLTAPGVSVAGSWVLTSRDASFGGLSGMVIEADRLTAVTDRGQWLTARLAENAGILRLSEARMAPIRRPDGTVLEGPAGDAEALARLGPDLFVAFERDHRIARHVAGGRLSEPIRSEDFAMLPFNTGLEALAALPEGGLLGLAEGRVPQGFPAFRVETDGEVHPLAALPADSRHDVTGADIGPNGALYVVKRHFSRATGVSIRLVRYALGADGLPDRRTATKLAAWEDGSGIDNMETIAVAPRPDGSPGVRLWLISDDNFNTGVQRTLLVALDVDP